MKKRYILFVWLALNCGQLAFGQSNSEGMQVEPVLAAQQIGANKKSMSEDEKISYLIDYVRKLTNATFIRNGDEYTPAKAADHLQSKWEKHKKKIKNAHDFVDKLASVSRSKDPYLIRYTDGNTVKLGDLLNKELTRIEGQ